MRTSNVPDGQLGFHFGSHEGPVETHGVATGPAVLAARTAPPRLDLASRVGVPVRVSARLKRGWRLERSGTGNVLVVPRELSEAPEEVCEALAAWVRTVRAPSPGSRLRRREAARTVFAWMGDAERLPAEASRGRHWDLRPLFDELNAVHFGGSLAAILRWTPRAGTTSTHRKAGGRDLITISSRFDHPSVPREAVLGVLSHEMLHIVHPPREGGGLRRHVHHREFREAERAFPFHRAWMDWEAASARRPWWKRLIGRNR